MYDPGQDTGGGDLYRPRADTNVRSGLRVTRRLRQCTAKQVARHTMAFALFLVRETLEAVTAGGVTGLTTSPAIRAPKHRKLTKSVLYKNVLRSAEYVGSEPSDLGKSARIDPAILSPPRFHNPYTTPARIPPASSYTVAGWMVFTSPLPKQHMYATFARIPISRIASAGWTILTSPVNEIASRCAAYALACLFNHSSKRGTQLSFAISALMMPTVTPKSATPRSTEKTQSEHSTTSQPDGEHGKHIPSV